VYKAVDPVLQRYVGWLEVEVALLPDGSASAAFVTASPPPEDLANDADAPPLSPPPLSTEPPVPPAPTALSSATGSGSGPASGSGSGSGMGRYGAGRAEPAQGTSEGGASGSGGTAVGRARGVGPEKQLEERLVLTGSWRRIGDFIVTAIEARLRPES
jgi:hypothetical protein